MRIGERVLHELAASTRFGPVTWLETVDSTNHCARDAAVAGAVDGLVVVADHQAAGRGRLGRRWESPPGASLLLSVVLSPEHLGVDRLHLLTAMVGLAGREACRAVAGFTPDLKWPNDLIVDGRKLAGILAEVVAGPRGPSVSTVVVGLGLNVTAAPPGGISATEAAGRPVERDDLLLSLLQAVDRRYGRWDEVAADYGSACATIGRRVRVEGVDGTVRTGLARAVDDAGRLIMAFDGEDGSASTASEVAVSAGDVFHLRPALGTAW